MTKKSLVIENIEGESKKEVVQQVIDFLKTSNLNDAVIKVDISDILTNESFSDEWDEEFEECDCSVCEDKHDCNSSKLNMLSNYTTKELLEELYLNRGELTSQYSPSLDETLDVYTFVMKKEGYFN